MLLIALGNWVLVFLEPFPSPMYTYTLCGGWCLTRVVHIFLQTHQMHLHFFESSFTSFEESGMLLVGLRNWVLVFLKSFPSPMYTYTLCGGWCLTRVVHVFLQTHQMHLDFFETSFKSLEVFGMLLIGLRNWVPVFLEPFPSPMYTYTLCGGWCLTRVVHIFLQTQQMHLEFFAPNQNSLRTLECCWWVWGTEYLCF